MLAVPVCNLESKFTCVQNISEYTLYQLRNIVRIIYIYGEARSYMLDSDGSGAGPGLEPQL